jgi:hypothetical protein
LKTIIKQSEKRVIQDTPDELFLANINFFVKSYLISICTYLEAYLQDVAFEYANILDMQIKNIKIPHNFVYWRVLKDIKDKDLDYKQLDLSVSRKDISENISANPYRTIKLFCYLGIDLTKSINFEQNKDLINTIVAKRNKIIHHNDKAADISFSDLLTYIEIFLKYIKSIDDTINSKKNK